MALQHQPQAAPTTEQAPAVESATDTELTSPTPSVISRKILDKPSPARKKPAPTPQNILQLQRTIGNQAVTRLLAHQRPAPQPATIQRYSIINQKERLSTTTNSLVVDGHNFYATPELVNAANEILKTAGGGQGGKAGAFMRLLADTTQKHQVYQNLVRVFPTVAVRDTTLPKNQAPRKEFFAKNKNAVTYISPADCHIAAQTVMGSDDLPSGLQDTEKAVIKGSDGNDKQLTSATGDGQGGKHLANRAKHAFYEEAMPRFAALIKNKQEYSDHQGVVTAIEQAQQKPARGVGTANEYAKIYRDSILGKPVLYNLFVQTFGINEYAKPVVGQAFSNINDEFQKDDLEKQNKDIWNFHWAGVVVVDGADYITLENLSVEDTNALNDKWYFQMYGAGNQSFHTEALKDSHATPAAITLGFTTTSQAEHPQPKPFQPSEIQKMILYWFKQHKDAPKTVNDFTGDFAQVGHPRLDKPVDTLKSIWQRFGYSGSDITNDITPENFMKVKGLVNDAIVELNLQTVKPEKPAPPPPLNLAMPPIPNGNGPLNVPPIPQLNAPVPQVNGSNPQPNVNEENK